MKKSNSETAGNAVNQETEFRYCIMLDQLSVTPDDKAFDFALQYVEDHKYKLDSIDNWLFLFNSVVGNIYTIALSGFPYIYWVEGDEKSVADFLVNVSRTDYYSIVYSQCNSIIFAPASTTTDRNVSVKVVHHADGLMVFGGAAFDDIIFALSTKLVNRIITRPSNENEVLDLVNSINKLVMKGK
ncbi:MAG: hypothetical protein QXQ02_00040 [Halobacteria archaeon]